jgi:cell shape-determining protein MreC
MNYLHDKKKERATRNIIIWIVFLGLIIFLLSRPAISNSLKSLASKIGIPFWKGHVLVIDAGVGAQSVFTSKSALIRERDALQNQIATLQAQLAEKDATIALDTEIKNIVDKRGAHDFIIAAILSKPNRSIYDTLVIDLGEKDGVKFGAKVFGAGIVPLGTISEVFASTSTVKLYSNPGEKFQVVVLGKDISTEATGKGGQNFEMTFPRDVEIPIGSSVALPGFPTQPFATVEKVMFDPRDPFQNVLLRSLVNVQELQIVQIEK